ncbi:YL1 nuclear protein C-terminal domain-containing protein [Kalaharituber pfeilii]|nr:YL1 nuclear protein C-terminal domain-containing protein [Kalaharituber pfeilii]
MAPQQPASNTVLDSLDITSLDKPFKNPYWKPPARRNKNLKQIVQEDVRSQAAAALSADAAAPSASGSSIAKPTDSVAATSAAAPPAPAAANRTSVGATYTNIESAPSFHPARAHWCDITGLPARYTDPKTKLRYADMEVYKAIQNLPPGSADGYLELRGANVVLK